MCCASCCGPTESDACCAPIALEPDTARSLYTKDELGEIPTALNIAGAVVVTAGILATVFLQPKSNPRP